MRFAGGWLFDRVTAGWEATVLTADPVDSRALRILGARGLALECALESAVLRPRPRAIAVDAELYGSDVRVRRMVRNMLHRGPGELWLWGDLASPEPDGGAGSVRHRLSVAARAFKAQALSAASAREDSMDTAELFRCAGPPRSEDTPELVST